MPFDHDQIQNLDAVIDGLDTPTSLETWQATDPYDAGMVAASAVRRALAGGGGGGGSAATDTVVTMTVAEPPAAIPIVAVSVADSTVTVAGDQRALIPQFSLDLDAGPNFRIAGSTGNDGDYVAWQSASYDAGSNRTTFTCDGGPPDSTPDGTLQPYFTALFLLSLPAQSTVEWLYFEVEEAFDPDDLSAFYCVVWASDADNKVLFAGKNGDDPGFVDLTTLGVYQWPTNTLNAPDAATVVVGHKDHSGDPTGIQYYPDGTTVRLLVSIFPATQVGSVRVTIHHHFDEVGVPVVNGV